jgi:endosialidase-like protein
VNGEADAVRGSDVLEKLAELSISTWNYKGDDPSVRHMGPMAQDFFAAFGLGDDDKTINLLDANGVVMVAIQALYRRVQSLESEIAALKDSRDSAPG